MLFRCFVPEGKKDAAGEDGVQHAFDTESQRSVVLVYSVYDVHVGHTARANK
jgi:hypothetical protein